MGNTTARKRRGSGGSRSSGGDETDGTDEKEPERDDSLDKMVEAATSAIHEEEDAAAAAAQGDAGKGKKRGKGKKKKKVRKKPDPNQFAFAKYLDSPGKIWDMYEELAVLGAGATCKVMHVLRKSDDEHFAMKMMRRKGKWNPIMFEQEVDFLSILKEHPHVVQIDASFYDDRNLYILTKLCTGGALFQRVKKLRHFSEAAAAKILAAILGTIAHCHKHDIVHRDLKPENIVYSNNSRRAEVVIIDFGDAKRVKPDEDIDDFLGTMYYLAPEIFRVRKGWEVKKSDVWTIGVIAYVLVCGRPPFTGADNAAIKEAILHNKVQWPSYVELSPSCKDFVLALMDRDTTTRLSAEEALQHPWIAHEAAKFDRHLGDEVLQSMDDYAHSSVLKKLVVHRVVKYMTAEDKSLLVSAFQSIDRKRKGYLQKPDLIKFLRKEYPDMSPEEVAKRTDEMVKYLDLSGDGKIKIDDFVNAKHAGSVTASSFLMQEFERLDGDGDGFISLPDLKRMLTTTYHTEHLEQVIDQIDLDGDGKISKEEFEKAMKEAVF